METLHAPRPQETRFRPNDVANEQAIPQDPWEHTDPNLQTAHPENHDLPPLDGMSLEEESKRFNEIAQKYDEKTGVGPTGQPFAEDHSEAEREYTPRHFRYDESTPFTATPSSDIDRRNEASRRATLAMAERLSNSDPAYAQEIQAGLGISPTLEKDPRAYRGRHRRRILGRIATFFTKHR